MGEERSDNNGPKRQIENRGVEYLSCFGNNGIYSGQYSIFRGKSIDIR